MGLALDEPKETDEVLSLDGFKVVADKTLLDDMGGVTINYRHAAFGGGFIIRPKGEAVSQGCSC